MHRLDGKVALVTGAGRRGGLGEAICLRLAQAGARVVVTDLGRPQGTLAGAHIGALEEMESGAAGLRGTKHAARLMIRQGEGGRVVNIASQAAKSGHRHMAAYTASKHGMVGLTRSAAMELGPHGITVNAVCPNHVTTGLGALQNEYFARLNGQTIEEYLAAMRERIPMRRVGLPGDTAGAVAYLCSDEAAYVTGEAMNVSGGVEMH